MEDRKNPDLNKVEWPKDADNQTFELKQRRMRILSLFTNSMPPESQTSSAAESLIRKLLNWNKSQKPSPRVH